MPPNINLTLPSSESSRSSSSSNASSPTMNNSTNTPTSSSNKMHAKATPTPRKRKAPSPSPSLSSVASTTKKNRKSASPSSSSEATTTSKTGNRGLRHFSLMVCRKVEEKGSTTYNEVADELVQQVLAERQRENPNATSSSYDEKNIRRRVYDALNVLMAMDIISKDKKEIHWKGLPESCHRDMRALQKERDFRQQQVQRKRQALKELLVQQVCFRNLVTRNQPSGVQDEKIPLPFIVVNTHSNAIIQCDMSRDRTDVMFDFSMPFEINDDNTILKRMGMDRTNMTVLQQMLPENLLDYSQRHGLLDNILSDKENPRPQQLFAHDSFPPHPAHPHPPSGSPMYHSNPPPFLHLNHPASLHHDAHLRHQQRPTQQLPSQAGGSVSIGSTSQPYTSIAMI